MEPTVSALSPDQIIAFAGLTGFFAACLVWGLGNRLAAR